MSYASYRDMPYKLICLEPFTGNSASARWTDSGIYEVLSYATVIATYTPGTGWNIPDKHYSRTTSRLQNIVRKVA